MSDIVLSAGVRQNLLALQSTANLMTVTQNRLATGKKVNTALDNPVNFFTSSGLQNRAGDLSALLDAMSNGVKTLQAADNGLSAITKTLQSMQSTLLQARQDKSYKTETFSVGTLNLASMPYLSFSGGSVGASPVQIALATNTGGSTTAATAATVTGGAFSPLTLTNVAATPGVMTGGVFGAMNFTNVAAQPASITGGSNFTSVDVTGGNKSFTLDVGGGPVTVNLTQAASGGDNFYSAAEIQTQVDTALGGSGIVTVGGGGGSPLTFTTVATGNSAEITIAGTDVADLGFTANDTDTGANAVTPTLTFNVAIDGGANTQVTINQAAVQSVGNNDTTIDTAAELQSIIDAQLGNAVTVSTTGGGTQLRLTSNTSGGGSSVAISGLTATGVANTSGLTNTTQTGTDAVTPTISFNIAIDGGPARLVTINQAAVQAVGNNNTTIDTVAELAAIVDAQLDNSVTVDVNAGALRFTSATTGGGSSIAISGLSATDVIDTTGIANTTATGSPSVITGGTNTAKTVDQIVNDINTNATLKNRVRASNDNGKISIMNLATGDLTVTGFDVGGTITGGVTSRTIVGNQVRANLATQYNDLRDQLDKFASDASFNGINLLNGDTLRMIFNETATSTIDIQAKDPNGNPYAFNALNLNIMFLQASDLNFDSSIDGLLGVLTQALNTTRSQASNFGSYLSIVENRQSFTKSMINTLKTGADNLTLADTNEEGANMLALQTRQQLSTTALSLAAQADQGVLRLFG